MLHKNRTAMYISTAPLLRQLVIDPNVLDIAMCYREDTGADPGFFVRKSKFDDIIGNDDVIDGDVRSNDVI